VADAIEELARAKVAVVPLLSGSGTRFKILEAWCAGTPVVSTRLGAEGLDAEAGRDYIAADGPGEFASAVLRLLQNVREQADISACGRAVFEQRYTIDRGWELLDDSGVF